MIEYTVKVYASGSKLWYLDGKRHREDGPAIEWADGLKYWYLNGKRLTKAQHKEAMDPKPSCNGKEVVIDGVTYILKEKQND